MIQPNHRISIPSILEVGKDNLSLIGKFLNKSNINNIVIFFGEGINMLFGSIITEGLAANNINILSIYTYDDITIESILQTAFSLPSNTEAVIAVGGGKVLDAAKYICFLRQFRFISIPTSVSNDGFASSTCSLIVNGRRTTVGAKVPHGIIVDLEILKTAPDKFIYSGIGDLISKITALYDWKFEENNGISTVDDVAVLIAKKSVNSFVSLTFEEMTR